METVGTEDEMLLLAARQLLRTVANGRFRDGDDLSDSEHFRRALPRIGKSNDGERQTNY